MIIGVSNAKIKELAKKFQIAVPGIGAFHFEKEISDNVPESANDSHQKSPFGELLANDFAMNHNNDVYSSTCT